MQITTNIDKEKSLRTHTIVGQFTIDELTEALKEVYKNPQYDSEMNVLWDIRDADASSFTMQDITKLSNIVSRQWGTKGESRAAIVVSRDLEYGLSRMYDMLSANQIKSQIKAFRDINEAFEWLSS